MLKRFCFRLFFFASFFFLAVFSVLAQLPSRDSHAERVFGNNLPESYRNAGVRKANNAPLTFTEQNVLREIINDFRVNDDTLSLFWQNLPSMARDLAGNFVITWTDFRSGYGVDIYAQRYNSAGTPLGSNFKVNDDISVSTEQNCPSIAIDALGNFVITWHDFRNGSNPDIYAQRYNSAGIALGSNFKVNDDAGTTVQAVPAIAMDFLGNFVITWDDYRNGSSNPDIYCQRYNSAGTPLGSNFKVNDDIGTTDQIYPAVTMDSSGNFIITWGDGRSGGGDIYAQRYNSSGTPLGSNFKVNDDAGSAGQCCPDIAMNSSGSFVITWNDNRLNSYSDIYAQRYNSSGTPLGNNFKVNDDAGTFQHGGSAVVMDGSGSFVITWSDYRNPYLAGEDVYAQRYDSAGTPLGSNFKVNDDAGTAGQCCPAIALDGLGNFVITWTDGRRGNSDIFAQRYSSSGTPLGTNFIVNDDVETVDQFGPVGAISGSGSFVVAWTDPRYGPPDPAIYAQRYNSSGTPLGSNFKVNEVYGWNHSLPAIAMDALGNFVLTWEDDRDGTLDIYAQRYNASGTPLGSNFKVNEVFGTFQDYFPAVAMNSSGSFVITWVCDSLSEVSPIYAQRYNSSGTPLGSNFRVNDLNMYSPEPPAIAMDNPGNFIITWDDWFLYAQRYDSSGTPLGSNFQVNDAAGQCMRPAIAMDSSDNSVITWEDYRNGNNDIYAQRYNSSGTPLDSNFKVNDDAGTTYALCPRVSMMCGNRFVITWQDDRNGTDGDIYAQNFAWNGLRLGNNYLVTDPLYESYQQDHPVVTANDSKVCFIWQDKREGTWDIYAKLFDCSSLFPSTPYPLTFVSWGPVHLIIIDPAGDSIGLGFNTIGNGSSYFTATNFDSVSIPNALIGNYQIRVTFAGLFKAPATYSLGIRIDGNDMTLLKNNENTPPPGQSVNANYNVLAYLIGDANKDNTTDIGDIVYLINYVFYGGEEPVPIELGDANCDGVVDIGDIVHLINYVFYGGNPPCS